MKMLSPAEKGQSFISWTGLGSHFTFAISRYRERGYETPRINKIMTARLSVTIHRKGMLGKEGKIAIITWGMVSPTMMQKAIMPPKALQMYSRQRHWQEAKLSGRTKPIEQPEWDCQSCAPS